MPQGSAFSVDAWRANRAGKPLGSPVVSWAVLAVTLQLALIYFFNAIQKNGETWSVPGCPMAPECAPAYFDAIERMEQAEREGSGAAAMTAAFDLACHVLAEAYPLLTRRVAHDFVLDPAVCRRVIFASQRGQAPPLPRDEEVERIRPRVAWCIANKDKVGTVDAIAAVIVDGIPDAEPKPKSEGDAKN